MGIELTIRAESAAELGVLLRDMVGAEHVIAAAARIDPEQKVVASTVEVGEKPTRASRKQKVVETGGHSPAVIVEADEGNALTGSTDESDPSSGTASTQTEAGPQSQDADEPQVVYADVQKAVTSLAAVKGRDAVVGVFKQFGVDHGTKLKPEQWVDAVAALETAKGDA